MTGRSHCASCSKSPRKTSSPQDRTVSSFSPFPFPLTLSSLSSDGSFRLFLSRSYPFWNAGLPCPSVLLLHGESLPAKPAGGFSPVLVYLHLRNAELIFPTNGHLSRVLEACTHIRTPGNQLRPRKSCFIKEHLDAWRMLPCCVQCISLSSVSISRWVNT